MMTYQQKIEERRRKFHAFILDFGVYLFCVLGVSVYLFFPDIKEGIHGVTFYLPRWEEAVVGMLVAIFAVWKGERSGNIEGKRKNFSRRAQSAALYGFAVAWATEQLAGVIK